MNQATRFYLVVAAVVAVFCVVIVMKGPDGPSTPTTAIDAGPEWGLSDGGLTADGAVMDDEVDVNEFLLVDGSETQRSVRVMHPSPLVTRRLLDWLTPRETKAVNSNASISCQADTATKRLVSVRCVTVPFYDPKKGGTAPNPEYTAMTLSITGRPNALVLKELTLSDVLKPGIGEKEVVEACKQNADPPLACVWPPTAFTINRGESLFICHDSSCVDLDPESGLIKEGLAGIVRH